MKETEFDTFILKHKDVMYRLAISMLSDCMEAEDAVQDVLEKLWMRHSELNDLSNVRSFALTSVRNNCIDRIRLRKKRRMMGADHLHMVAADREMNVAMETKDMGRLAGELIACLPEKQRLIIHLRDVEGFSMEEIAAVSQMDEATVRVNLSRARKSIREKMIKIISYGTVKN